MDLLSLIPLALKLLEWLSARHIQTKEQRERFLALAQTLREIGAIGARSRYESEDRQNTEIDEAWKGEGEPPSKTTN